MDIFNVIGLVSDIASVIMKKQINELETADLPENIAKIRDSYISEIKKQFSKLEKKKSRFRWLLFLSVFLIIVGMILFIANIIISSNHNRDIINNEVFFSFSAIFGFGLIILMYYLIEYNKIKNTFINLIESLKNELELIEVDDLDYVKQSRKIFSQSQKDVKRYYDLNIGQLRFIFPLGVTIIIVGIFVIMFTLIVFLNTNSEEPLGLIIGCVSGILVDFIGAIFIKMYIETINSSTKFYERLVSTNNLLFANSLLSRIENNEIRDTAFHEVAKEIANKLQP